MSIQFQPHHTAPTATHEKPTLGEKAKALLIDPFLRQGMSPKEYCTYQALKDPARFTDPNAMNVCIKSARVYKTYLESSFPA